MNLEYMYLKSDYLIELMLQYYFQLTKNCIESFCDFGIRIAGLVIENYIFQLKDFTFSIRFAIYCLLISRSFLH